LGLGIVSLGPGGGDIDGHQISYIRRHGGAKFGQKNFHVIGSAEPPRRRVVSNACDLLIIVNSGKTLTREQGTSFQERLRIRYRICAAMEGMISWAITNTDSGGTFTVGHESSTATVTVLYS